MENLFSKIWRCFWVLWLLFTMIGVAQASSNKIISMPDSEALRAKLLASGWVRAYEHILSFDTHARFNTDGSMEVTENIKVLSLGEQIRRGIFRTLPLTWNRQDGKIFSVDYQIKNVLRDGIKESFSVVKDGKTLTVRMGSADYLLKPGIYNYVIQYQVSNHFSRFHDWDELYWNVTGNDWAYPITKASFHLELPDAKSFLNSEGKDTRLRTIDVYTGMRGEKGQNAQIQNDGSVLTLQPLDKGQGLTVVYTWPRNILAGASAPQASSPLGYLLLPTFKTSILWTPIFLIAGYYFLWWRKNVMALGLKMPPIIPLFVVPSTMSPGYLRYITERKYDDVAFTSDMLDLVAKRVAVIITKKRKPKDIWSLKGRNAEQQWLSSQPGHGKELNSNAKHVLRILFNPRRKNIDLSKAHQQPVINARQWLDKCYTDQQEELFFTRLGPIFRGMLIILLVPVICGLFFSPITAFLTIPALVFFMVGIGALSVFIRFLCSPRYMLNTFGGVLILMAMVFGPFGLAGSAAFMFAPPLSQMPAGYIGALLAAMVLCTIFAWKVPRYTQQGMKDLAIAKGLKLYLSAAEKHRYQTLYPPDKMVSHFEEMQPVALALGVGKTWANTFAQYLTSTGAISEVFADADWENVHHFSRSCRSSSTVFSSGGSGSGSSSSGSGSSGGGSSGGGSGGGGGGGW